MLAVAFLATTLCTSLRAQQLTPIIPMGNISAFPTIVQAGTHPTLTWDITLPERVSDVVTIQGGGTIIPNRDLIMDVRVIGAPVKLVETDAEGNVSDWQWAPTQAQLSYDGYGYGQIFYNIQSNVNPNFIAAYGEVSEGAPINIGGRYVNEDGSWSPFQSSTSSIYNVIALQDGDTPPTSTPILELPTLQPYLLPYLDENGKVTLGARDVLVLIELTHTDRNDPGFDLQDLALIITFYDKTSNDTGTVPDGSIDVKSNNGHGNNADGVDSSNPGKAPFTDTDPNTDDEITRRGRRVK